VTVDVLDPSDWHRDLMICPDCHGTGRASVGWMGGVLWRCVPCDTCSGSGVAYCGDDAGSDGNMPAVSLRPAVTD
jgi:DnaJ-class molecular chaperone